MQHRILGKALEVSALGLGCMGMSDFYGAPDDAASMATLARAVDLGVTFFDTADMYGPYTNELLVGQTLRPFRNRVVLATKFGIVRDPRDPAARGVNGRPDYARAACEGSLKRLGVDHIDLYYQHRLDPGVPIEDTVGAMADLVKQGKVRFIGLSEVSAATLRRAHAVHPVTAVQSEYSLWTRDPEAGVLAACRELGVGFVPYSPLGRGFLTGAFKSASDLLPGDYRSHTPRFQDGNLDRNLALVAQIEAMAREKGCTAAQLAIAWVLAQGEDIVPIPGTKRPDRLEENLGALEVPLSVGDLARLAEVFAPGAAAGDRYPPAMMQRLDR